MLEVERINHMGTLDGNYKYSATTRKGLKTSQHTERPEFVVFYQDRILIQKNRSLKENLRVKQS